MPIQPCTIVGVITTGRLVAPMDTLRAVARGWPDGDVTLTMKRKTRNRRLQQNRWYWGCVLALISETTGYEPEELHEFFKLKYFPKAVTLADGNGVICDEGVIGGTTTRLDTAEFGEYCERIRRFAAEHLSLDIPDPEAS